MSDFKNRHLIETQIPYHIREQNPLFVKFLEYYYEFLENSKINSSIQDVLDYNNSDKVDLQILQEFFEEIKQLPKNLQVDKRLLATRIYDLYKAKGSEDALKLLFRLAFNENIAVTYPQENILRASDGRWVRDALITFQLNPGEVFDSAVNTLVIETNIQVFRFKIKKIETDIPARYRIYFDARQNFTLDINQQIKLYIEDQEVCTGVSTTMVSNVEIIVNGTNWQKGQVIVIPGTNKDTILQIDSVNYTGTIQKLNIIQYGDGHNFLQVYTFSTFQYIPSNEYSEYYSIDSNSVAESKEHYLDIGDFVKSKSVSQKLDFNDNGNAISIPNIESDIEENSNIISYSGFVDVPANITLDQWLSSRLKIKLKSSNIVFLPGYYSEEKSLISSYFSKLQDNEYYQIFSYVIETSKTLLEYLPILNLVHPAGIKHFSSMVKQIEYNVGIIVDRILSQSYLFIDDNFNVSENIDKFDVVKNTNNDIDISENIDKFDVVKNTVNTVNIVDIDIEKIISLIGISTSNSIATGNITGVYSSASISNAISIASSTLEATARQVGVSIGTSIVDSNFPGEIPIAGISVGTSTASSVLKASANQSATSVGTSTASSVLRATANQSSTSVGTSTASAVTDKTLDIFDSIVLAEQQISNSAYYVDVNYVDFGYLLLEYELNN